MSEYISKQEAIEAFSDMSDGTPITHGDMISDTTAVNVIKSIPSADVRENKRGHWIKINSGDEDFPESIVCDRCNHENSHLDFNEHNEPIGKVFVTSNFCPNCGADMRETKGEKGD